MSGGDTKPKVTVISSDRYQRRFPQRRLITRDTLQLVKMLRAHGAEVRIEPENGLRLEYVFYKGFVPELFAAPLVIAAAYFARDVLAGIVSNWLYSSLPGGKGDQAGANIAIEITEAGRTVRCNIAGAEISDERFNSILETIKVAAQAKPPGQMINSPFPDLPTPIFLEHSDKIVGWGRIDPSDLRGLKIEAARIVDDETWRRVKAGELKGASIAAIAKETECSICGRDYVDCENLTSQTYGGRTCTNTIKAADLLEISLVKDPVNPKALIKIKGGG